MRGPSAVSQGCQPAEVAHVKPPPDFGRAVDLKSTIEQALDRIHDVDLSGRLNKNVLGCGRGGLLHTESPATRGYLKALECRFIQSTSRLLVATTPRALTPSTGTTRCLVLASFQA